MTNFIAVKILKGRHDGSVREVTNCDEDKYGLFPDRNIIFSSTAHPGIMGIFPWEKINCFVILMSRY
jgi:hypothetical protein